MAKKRRRARVSRACSARDFETARLHPGAKDSSSASESITSRTEDDDVDERRKGKLASSQELIRFPLIKDADSACFFFFSCSERFYLSLALALFTRLMAALL